MTTQTIHGTGLFTYIYHKKPTIHVGKYTLHVGKYSLHVDKYTNPMDPKG